MERIDGANTTALPGGGAGFQDRNLLTGTPGTTVTAKWANNVQEEIVSVLTAAGIVLDGTNFGQLLEALDTRYGTSLCGVQVFTVAGTHTYTPTPGTVAVLVEVQGAGGPGGGAAATGAGQIALGSGGAAGAYASSRLTAGFAGVTITVGAGGAGIAGGAGTSGGTSSFGALVSAPGGLGGTVTGPQTPPWMTGVSTSSAATGGNIINSVGASGGESIALSSTVAYGAQGGASHFGGGGGIVNSNVPGVDAVTPGAGGSGTANLASQASTLRGGSGKDGIVIVWEFK